MLSNLEETLVYSPREVFFCPEESRFYAQCLEKMFFNDCYPNDSIIEFGSGDGSPVINSLLKTQFKGIIDGYELNIAACKLAESSIHKYNLSRQYVVHNQCFFEGLRHSQANYLIANPPYIPAPDQDIRMPTLYGGTDGAAITNQLLAEGCENVLVMISAYSNPVETIELAIAQGYKVVDFTISPLQFGYYSSEPKVKQYISNLHKTRKAFYSSNIYFLAGVLFSRQCHSKLDLSSELITVMTAL